MEFLSAEPAAAVKNIRTDLFELVVKQMARFLTYP